MDWLRHTGIGQRLSVHFVGHGPGTRKSAARSKPVELRRRQPGQSGCRHFSRSPSEFRLDQRCHPSATRIAAVERRERVHPATGDWFS
jgi:hypothetical protein